MDEINVGKLLNIVYNTNTKSMQITLDIIDDNFKERLLRNNVLKDKIIFKGADVIWIAKLNKEI